MDDLPMVEWDVLVDVAAAFSLGEVTDSAAYVDGGVSGQVFKVATVAGDWAVKRLFELPDLAQLEAQTRLQDAARTAGIVSPQAARTADGTAVATIDGVHWQASEWVEVARDNAELVKRERLVQVGEVLATLHCLRLDPQSEITPWLTTPPSAAAWTELRSAVRESRPRWAATFEDLYPELLRLATFAGSVVHRAAVLSHCDLGPANVGAAGDHLVVFDWERAGATPPIQELGYVLMQWTERAHPATIIPPIMAGYRARTDETMDVGVDMFACAANAFLNFLYSAVRSTNDHRAVQMLDNPVTLQSLEVLAELASRS